MNNRRFPMFSALATTVLVTIAAAQGVPDPDLDRAHHVARRLGFGVTPALVADLSTPSGATTPLQKVQDYIQQQLHPAAAMDPFWPYGSQSVRDMVMPGGALGLPAAIGSAVLKVDVDSAQLAYAMASKWQLREVMGQFWERHFNTALIQQKYFFAGATGAVTPEDYCWWFEWQANDWYRQNALTTFHDLLRFTSQHASMMVYLHMPQNVAGTPNEDYARELCELYTMSPELPVPGGAPIPNYEQKDIEEIARVLTGWSVDPANQFAFVFNSTNHSYPTTAATLFTISGSPVTLPLPTAPNGDAEGLRLLRTLAGRPATADFICRKLIAHFVAEDVADAPGSTLLANMKGVWGMFGDIKAVLNVLFTSNEFLGNANHLRKARIPLEAVVAPARALDATLPIDPVTTLPVATCLWTLDLELLAMGQSLLTYPAPNGFSTAVAAQMSPSIALERARLGTQGAFGTPSTNLHYDVVTLVHSLLPAAQWQNFVAVDRVLLGALYGSNYSAADEVQVAAVVAGAVAYINNFGTGALAGPFDANNQDHYWAVVNCAAACAAGMTQSGLR